VLKVVEVEAGSRVPRASGYPREHKVEFAIHELDRKTIRQISLGQKVKLSTLAKVIGALRFTESP
jgi:hypothetical protein